MEHRFRPVFVKTKSTAATPLVLIFRLCNDSAAETLWREFKNEDLRTTLGNALMSYEKLKETFSGEELEIIVRIPDDSYDKVLRTLRDTKGIIFIELIRYTLYSYTETAVLRTSTHLFIYLFNIIYTR